MKLSVLFLLAVIFSCNQNSTAPDKLSKISDSATEVKGKNKSDSLKNHVNISDSSSTETPISEIRSEYNRINSGHLLKKVFPFSCKNDPAEGTVAYYSENSKVVKIAIDWGFAGDYASNSEYYFKN